MRTGSSLLMDLEFRKLVTVAQVRMIAAVTRNHRGFIVRFDFAMPKEERPMDIIVSFRRI